MFNPFGVREKEESLSSNSTYIRDSDGETNPIVEGDHTLSTEKIDQGPEMGTLPAGDLTPKKTKKEDYPAFYTNGPLQGRISPRR